MNTALLFRKRAALAEDGLPWLNGSDEHPFTARRNQSGSARPSAILVRGLLAVLEGAVEQAQRFNNGVYAIVASQSRPGISSACWLDWENGRCGLPHGTADKVTYHIGVLGVVEALGWPERAADFWQAYAALLPVFQAHGREPILRAPLCRAADELYYFLQYRETAPEAGLRRLESLQLGPNDPAQLDGMPVRPLHTLNVLTDPEALAVMNAQQPVAQPELPALAEAALPAGFVGGQVQCLAQALAAGENVLLAGPTGSGKTYALHQVVGASHYLLAPIEGKEGLTDLDFLGAILPQPNSGRAWVDGPLLRAMRLAASDPVLLFLDEINRIPRPHLNLLLGLMTPKSGDTCRRMGLELSGEGPFYVIEVPMTSELVACPAAHLRFAAAGNFGRAYQVYDLDPALRRRFETVVEFDYLPYTQELALLARAVPTLSDRVREALVRLAQETRRLAANGELPGCLDTASLLNWAKKCARANAASLAAIMELAGLTWADTVCGRDHQGRVNQGSFQALQDYLESLKVLG